MRSTREAMMDVGCNAMERTVQWFMTDDVCLSFTATEDR